MILLGLSAVLAGLGVLGLLSRKTLLGFVVSFQLLGYAVASALFFVGNATGTVIASRAAVVFVVVVTVAQSFAAIALALRSYYLHRSNEASQARELRH